MGQLRGNRIRQKNDLNESIQNPELKPKYPELILPNRTQSVLIIHDQFQITNTELTWIQLAQSRNIPYREPIDQYRSTGTG